MIEIVLITLFLVVLSIIPFTKWYLKRAAFARKVNVFPGPPVYPLIGTAHIFLGVSRENLHKHITAIKQRYPNVMRSWLGPVPQVELKCAEYIEKVLSSGKLHLEKSWSYRFVRVWLGEGLLTSSGAKWFKHRKIITPTFHFKILENFCDVFDEKTRILVNRLNVQADSGKQFNIYPYITKVALDIIADAAMGTNVNAQNDEENEYVTAVYQAAELIIARLLQPWKYSDTVYNLLSEGKSMKKCLKVLHSFTAEVIEQRRQVRAASEPTKKLSAEDELLGKKNRLAFLDLLLDTSENGSQTLSNDDIREEVDTFMFEGHDTTTAGISWTILLLGLHPDIQEQCYTELENIFQGSDRPATITDFGEMKVLDRVIKESLRLYPSVPFIGRTASEDIKLDDKYTIPNGCTIFIDILSLHQDAKYFPDPQRFDPDRFLPENTMNRHPYSYIPFSAGSRNCIGQKFAIYEEKSILSSILRNFKITSHAKREDIHVVLELVSRPFEGVPVTLEKRIK